jgi:3',5'-nucleoside bisphosphate phosphatase
MLRRIGARRCVALTRIDLHVHSSSSDGTDPARDLPGLAVEAGLDVVAITDHDTTRGWAAAIEALPPGLTLVPGAELSCATAVGDRRVSMHLLALLFDPDEPEFAAARAAMRASRLERVDRWEALLRAEGFGLSLEPLRLRAATGVVGRPDLAAALVEAGFAPDFETAIGPLWAGGRFWAPKVEWDAEVAIALVRAAGGVAVFAHPYARRRGPVVGSAEIRRLAAAGLHGLEIDHPDHDATDRAALRELAAELDLVVTGGSDYHGTRKWQSMAEETTAPEEFEKLLGYATGRSVATA